MSVRPQPHRPGRMKGLLILHLIDGKLFQEVDLPGNASGVPVKERQ
jgi:hypothetical protein